MAERTTSENSASITDSRFAESVVACIRQYSIFASEAMILPVFIAKLKTKFIGLVFIKIGAELLPEPKNT